MRHIIPFNRVQDLSYQLGIFIIVRLTLSNLMDFFAPYLVMWYSSWLEGRQFAGTFEFIRSDAALHLPDLSSAERQSKIKKYAEFEDMDEMLVTFGLPPCSWSPAPWCLW